MHSLVDIRLFERSTLPDRAEAAVDRFADRRTLYSTHERLEHTLWKNFSAVRFLVPPIPRSSPTSAGRWRTRCARVQKKCLATLAWNGTAAAAALGFVTLVLLFYGVSSRSWRVQEFAFKRTDGAYVSVFSLGLLSTKRHQYLARTDGTNVETANPPFTYADLMASSYCGVRPEEPYWEGRKGPAELPVDFRPASEFGRVGLMSGSGSEESNGSPVDTLGENVSVYFDMSPGAVGELTVNATRQRRSVMGGSVFQVSCAELSSVASGGKAASALLVLSIGFVLLFLGLLGASLYFEKSRGIGFPLASMGAAGVLGVAGLAVWGRQSDTPLCINAMGHAAVCQVGGGAIAVIVSLFGEMAAAALLWVGSRREQDFEGFRKKTVF